MDVATPTHTWLGPQEREQAPGMLADLKLPHRIDDAAGSGALAGPDPQTAPADDASALFRCVLPRPEPSLHPGPPHERLAGREQHAVALADLEPRVKHEPVEHADVDARARVRRAAQHVQRRKVRLRIFL